MRRTWLWVVSPLLILLVSVGLFFARPEVGKAARDAQVGEVVTFEKPVTNAGRFLVKFKPGVTPEQVQERLARARWSIAMDKPAEFKVEAFSHVDNLGYIVLPGLENKVYRGIPPQLSELKRILRGMVEYIEPDYQWKISLTPNDPDYNSLWGLATIQAESAWDLSTGSDTVYVVVIDTGIDYTHPDLNANMAQLESNCLDGVDNDNNGHVDDCYGYDAANDDSDPMDGNGHGTHVAGTIGAVGNNNVGVVGVNWNVKLIACKFMTDEGWGWTSDAIECLNYVHGLADAGVNIVATNNSWGGGLYSQALYDAIKDSLDRGILFIAAAGNSGANIDLKPSYPAAYNLPNIISVAASTSADTLAGFSNWGKMNVDLAAPGVGILSTLPGNQYGEYSGTSMAAPHVTGVAALTKAYRPTATGEQIRNRILLGVDTLSSLTDLVFTDGRLNAANTLGLSGVSRLWGAYYPEWLLYQQDFPVTAASFDENGPADWVTVNGISLTRGLYGEFSGTISFPADWILETEDSFNNLNIKVIDPAKTRIGYANGYAFDGPSMSSTTPAGIITLDPGTSKGDVEPAWATIRLDISDYDEACQKVYPPFPIRLYGYPVKELYICTNGVIAAAPLYYADQDDTNFPLDRAPFFVIAPLSMDFLPGATSDPEGGIYLKYSSNQFIVEWRSVPEYGCLINSGTDCEMTFRMVVNHGYDSIVFLYEDTNIDTTTYSIPPLVGIQWYNLEYPYSAAFCDSDTTNTVADCDLASLNGQMVTATPNYIQIFDDVPISHPDQFFISRLYLRRWTTGCGAGSYCPDSTLTRAQMITFLVRILDGEDFPYSTTPYFEDVPATNWAFKYVQRAYETGLTVGCGDPDNNGQLNFCPGDSLKRAHVITFVVRAEFGENFSYSQEPYFDDVPPTYWAFKYIQKAYEMGLIDQNECGYRQICPAEAVQRAEMARFLIRWQEE